MGEGGGGGVMSDWRGAQSSSTLARSHSGDTGDSMKSYHLKWASHLPNMGLVFSTLYQSEGLSDCRLVCEDGSVRAHKLLLSTCSDYFLVRHQCSAVIPATQFTHAGAGEKY